MYCAIETNFVIAAVVIRFILSIDHSLTTTNWINVIYHENEQFSQRGLVYSTLRRNSFKLAKKPQNLSKDENAIVLVVIREKKLTFLLSPQVNLRSGDPCLSFCLGDEKKGPYRRLTTGRPGVLYANTGNNKASGFMGPRKRVGAGVD